MNHLRKMPVTGRKVGSFMKKILSFLLLAALLLSLLSGCGSDQVGNPSQQTEDLSWQDTPTVPQENKSLTVFCMDLHKDSKLAQLAITRYRALHPDVEVDFQKQEYVDHETNEEIFQQVAAEIMAGKGPDVLLLDDMNLDIEKLVRQGVLADMEPFFEADGFDWTPYQQTIMDGGVWNGKRYIIPLSYDFPLLFTTREVLEETGFDVDACGDFMGFLEETTRFMEDPAQTRRLFFNNAYPSFGFPGYSGIHYADYGTKTADLSSPELKAGLLWFKTVNEKWPLGAAYAGGLRNAASVRDGEALWADDMLGALNGFYNQYSALKTVGEPVMMPIRDLNGTIQAKIQYPVAVRGNSENLQNAYDFIKILLSEEIQRGYDWQELSVLNSVNDYFFQKTAAGKSIHILAGTDGFNSTTREHEAVDWPTEEEYQEFLGYVNEISGTYYYSHLNVVGKMNPFWIDGADYAETAQSAKQKIEIYLSE